MTRIDNFNWQQFIIDCDEQGGVWHRTLTDTCRRELQDQCSLSLSEVNKVAEALDIRVSIIKSQRSSVPMSNINLNTLSFVRWVQMNNNISVINQDIQNIQKQISGRCIEYFITVYAKIKNLVYFLEYDEHGMATQYSLHSTPTSTPFHIFSEYQSCLTAYSKSFFDAFDRGVTVAIADHQTLSICQAIFFIWCNDTWFWNI
jgi:hypothetical protein